VPTHQLLQVDVDAGVELVGVAGGAVVTVITTAQQGGGFTGVTQFYIDTLAQSPVIQGESSACAKGTASTTQAARPLNRKRGIQIFLAGQGCGPEVGRIMGST
jgi:hypothetical protein